MIWLLILSAVILLWIRSGRSPLLWMAWVLLHLEAIRQQVWSTAGVAVRHFFSNYRDRAQAVRVEASERFSIE